MALDKLVDSTQLDSDLTSVANAIRAKSGTSGQLQFPGGFVDAVEAIQTGGGITVDDIGTGALPAGDITISVIPTRYSAFCNMHNIGKVTATYSGDGAALPGTYLFQQSSITEFVGLNVNKINQAWFLNCKSLLRVTAPRSTFYDNQAFMGCYNLTTVDLGSGAINRGKVFDNCKKLQAIILRGNTLCALGNVTNLNSTPFRGTGDAGLTGVLYVPSALVQQYKEASNWSTLYTGGTMDVQPIEGSIYETAYADGTPIT